MQRLIQRLEDYRPVCEQEARDRRLMLEHLRTGKNPLSRDNETAHFTASSWIVSPDKRQVLMVYHNLYGSWSWSGGHADGDPDLHAVARREAQEETGVSLLLSPLGDQPISVEILPVYGHEKRGRYVSTHLHYNMTYLLIADPASPVTVKPDENSAVAWFSAEEALAAPTEYWMVDMVYRKLHERVRYL
ncbi:MAG: NUDIX hydrolase [Clostridia bacterium]|nr:NUDIX hydrolase [Clostridia bacterium]